MHISVLYYSRIRLPHINYCLALFASPTTTYSKAAAGGGSMVYSHSFFIFYSPYIFPTILIQLCLNCIKSLIYENE